MSVAKNNKDLSTRAYEFGRELLMGGVSGVIAKTSCAPLERVKILLQVQSASLHKPDFVPYKGIVDCFLRVVREQGMFLQLQRAVSHSDSVSVPFSWTLIHPPRTSCPLERQLRQLYAILSRPRNELRIQGLLPKPLHQTQR
jgi:hypothetical protein